MASVILGMAITTFGLRFLFIGLATRYRLPSSVEQTLAFTPPVVLSSIVITTISNMTENTVSTFDIGVIYFSLLIAFGLTLYKRNILLALIAGMSVYAAMKTILSQLLQL